MQKQTGQNPFSAVVSMFITEGVYGHRRQGLDHQQPKHLKGVMHNEIETIAKTFRLQVLRGGGGFHFPAFPVLASMPSISRSPLVGDSGRSMILGGGHFPCHKFPRFMEQNSALKGGHEATDTGLAYAPVSRGGGGGKA